MVSVSWPPSLSLFKTLWNSFFPPPFPWAQGENRWGAFPWAWLWCLKKMEGLDRPVCLDVLPIKGFTLPETNIAPENRQSQKETIVFQPSIFRCELLVSGRVNGVKEISYPPKKGLTMMGLLFVESFLLMFNRDTDTYVANPVAGLLGTAYWRLMADDADIGSIFVWWIQLSTGADFYNTSSINSQAESYSIQIHTGHTIS